MADSQHNDGHPYDPILEESFAFDAYYPEDWAKLAGAPDSEPMAPSGAGPPNLTARFEPYREHEHPSKTAAASPESQATSADGRFGSLKGPSQSTEIGTEPPRQQGQLSKTNNSLDELEEVDRELEQIELKLRRSELLKRRQVLLQKPPLPQQEQPSECRGSQDDQNPSASSDGVASVTDQSGTPNNTSQGGVLFVSTAFEMT